jgi:hypothetical protein
LCTTYKLLTAQHELEKLKPQRLHIEEDGEMMIDEGIQFMRMDKFIDQQTERLRKNLKE